MQLKKIHYEFYKNKENIPDWLFSPLVGMDIETTSTDDGPGDPVLCSFGIETEECYRGLICEPVQANEIIQALVANKSLLLAFNLAFDMSKLFFTMQKEKPEHSLQLLSSTKHFLDLMLFDILITLATVGEIRYQSLAKLCPFLTKSDEIRLTFSPEMMLHKEQPIYAKWWEYAVLDAAVLPSLYKQQLREAEKICDRVGFSKDQRNKLWDLFGPLTLKIQSQAAVALSIIGQTGVPVCKSMYEKAKQENIEKINEVVHSLNIWKKYKSKKNEGKFKTNKFGIPSMELSQLESLLDAANPKYTSSGRLAVDAKTLQTLANSTDDESIKKVIEGYLKFISLRKLHSYLTLPIENGRITTNYTPIVRTGRTAAYRTNIQQFPKEYRYVFQATEGNVFVICDYKYIELVTLAAILKSKYGWSKLDQVLRSGVDPHFYTARLLVSDWDKLTEEEKKNMRQAAKAINFGVPGGLGVKKLIDYSWWAFGVKLDEETAVRFKRKLCENIYPEMKLWLKEDICKNVSQSLGLPYKVVLNAKEDLYQLSEQVYKHGGKNIKIPPSLNKLAQKSPWANGMFSLQFLQGTAVSLTGRCRWPVSYTEERNTKFQGLAADGGKYALLQLLLRGWKVIAFIHDEILVEVEESRAEECLEDVKKIMIESMRFVIQDPTAPVLVSGSISKSWEKV